MKIKVPQNDLICNLRYVKICDYAHSFTGWINNGIKNKLIKNNNIIEEINKDNRKCISIYSKNGYELLEFFNLIRNVNKKIILVTGSSDYAVTNKVYKFKTDNIVKWYSENVDYKIENLIPIPMGSLSATWIGNSKEQAEIYNHKEFRLVKTNNEEPKIKNLAFMCFSLETNRNHREPFYKFFDNKSWVTNLCNQKTGKYLDDSIFMENVYNHHFVLSPFGGGIDCGRTWMTIQLGSIPIMPYHYCFEEWAKNLPILLYNDINEITETYLLQKLDEFKNKEYNYDFLKTSYWKNKFEEDILFYST